MNKVKGTLIPIGGNEDKGLEANEMYTFEFIDEGILYHVALMQILLLFQQHQVFQLKLAKTTWKPLPL